MRPRLSPLRAFGTTFFTTSSTASSSVSISAALPEDPSLAMFEGDRSRFEEDAVLLLLDWTGPARRLGVEAGLDTFLVDRDVVTGEEVEDGTRFGFLISPGKIATFFLPVMSTTGSWNDMGDIDVLLVYG